MSLIVFVIAGCGGGGSGPEILSLSQSNLAFNAPFGGTSPAPATVDVTITGRTPASFNATSDSPWLSVTPGNGTTPQAIQISVALGALTTANYAGHITVTASGVQGSPATIAVTFAVGAPPPSNSPFWAQWGANPQHTGMVAAAGQNTAHLLADIVYDKFVPQESAEGTPLFGGPALLVHYQVPLLDGNDVYMATKSGTYTSCNPIGAWQNGQACGPNTWNTMIWNETRFTWENAQLIHIWDFQSDWKPAPDSLNGGIGVDEPVFHAVEANGFIYVPGASGTVWKVNKTDGTAVKQINPFANAGNIAKNTYVFGPLTADVNGNIYYNAIELADSSLGDPWLNDPVNSWLVKITPQDASSIVTYATLTPNAPAASAMCEASYSVAFDPATTLPWPPAGFPAAPTHRCGPQRPGANIAPAVALDGTVIYTATRAHSGAALQSFFIAVNSNLTLKWTAPMQHLLHDGCGVIVPINDASNSNVNFCRFGTTPGVDPTTNTTASFRIADGGTSSPTVLPDGSVVFGARSNYNAARGHLLHFDSQGNFLNEFDFGWDSTPAVYAHNGTFSVILKDNHYAVPLYCNGNPGCQTVPEVYYITQVNPSKPDPLIPEKMLTEWSFQGTNTQSCKRNPDGTITCVSDHPNGFEWCINMPAVDMNGNVFVTSEDGNIYAIPQGNSGVFTAARGNLFLNLALGAAYTPLAIGPDGKFYTQNNGHLFVVGN